MSQDTQFLDKLDQLLEKLVPPSSVTITSCNGEEITLPGAIPARRQVVVFRLMRELSQHPSAVQALGKATGGETAAIIDAILALAIEPEIAEKLAEIFDEAYPGVLGGAAIDLLGLEEIVTALVPFSERFIRRLGSGMSALASSASELT